MCCTLSTGIRRPVDARLAKQSAGVAVFSRRTSASVYALQRRSTLTFMTRGVTVNEFPNFGRGRFICWSAMPSWIASRRAR